MDSFKTSDGLTLAYSDAGAGLPVLCLAGLTRNMHDFDFMAPHVPHVRLIRLDSRGRGQSDYDPDWKNYSVPVEMRDVVELLDHLSLDKVAVIGSSRGGMLAMLLATLHKNRLSGVLLNDVGPVLDAKGLGLIAAYIGQRPPYKTKVEAVAARPASMPGFHNVPMARWQAEADYMWVEKPDGLDLTYDPKLRDGVVEELKAPMPDLWPLFDCLAGLPTALLRGANSNLLTVETAAEMRARRPDMIF